MSNETKSQTAAQHERQITRSDASGRYTKLNPCEGCGKSAGANYYSDERCNTNRGKGLVLCSKCAASLAKLSDAEYSAFPWKL
jgi:predicted SprT family Zn-dependent metalloprotease